MKSKYLFLVFILSIVANFSFSQKVDEKTRHYFINPPTIEKTNLSIDFQNVVSKFNYIKFAIILDNKSEDFLIWINEKSKIIIADGEKNPFRIKTFKARPHKAIKRTFEVRGGEQFLVNEFKFVLNGLYRVPVEGNTQKVEDFKLPEEKNTIKAGDFTINLKKVKKKTDETAVYFEAIYSGNDYAIVRLNEINVRVKDNQVFANDHKKPKPFLLKKGDKVKIKCLFHIPSRVVDMQFADMFIQFNNAFSVSKAIAVDGFTVEFKLNEDLTKEKN